MAVHDTNYICHGNKVSLEIWFAVCSYSNKYKTQLGKVLFTSEHFLCSSVVLVSQHHNESTNVVVTLALWLQFLYTIQNTISCSYRDQYTMMIKGNNALYFWTAMIKVGNLVQILCIKLRYQLIVQYRCILNINCASNIQHLSCNM